MNIEQDEIIVIDETEDINEKLMQEEKSGEYVDDGEWNVPMPSHSDYIKDKKIDFNALSIAMVNSNFDNLQDYGLDRNAQYGERYIYESKLIKGIEECGKRVKTEIGKIRKIAKCKDSDLINIEICKGQTVYRVEYAKDGRYFVTIPSKMINFMTRVCKSNVIKTYIVLRYNLVDEKTGQTKAKQMSMEWLAEQIGETRPTMEKILKTLNALGYIKRELKPFKIQMTNGDIQGTKEYEYKLVGLEEWTEHIKSL